MTIASCTSPALLAKHRLTERWPSGRRRTPGKCVGGKPSPGFESLSLRHPPLYLSEQSFFPCFLPFFRGVGGGHSRERRPHIPVSDRFPGAVSGAQLRRWGLAISLITGNLQGNFRIPDHLREFLSQITSLLQWLRAHFPARSNREILRLNSEFFQRNRVFCTTNREGLQDAIPKRFSWLAQSSGSRVRTGV